MGSVELQSVSNMGSEGVMVVESRLPKDPSCILDCLHSCKNKAIGVSPFLINLCLFIIYCTLICPYEIKYIYGSWDFTANIFSDSITQNVSRDKNSCWMGPRCDVFVPPPVLIILNETYFPNGTNGLGEPIDYHNLLIDTLMVILQTTCDLRVSIITGPSETELYANHTRFKTYIFKIIGSTLLAEKNCYLGLTAAMMHRWRIVAPVLYEPKMPTHCPPPRPRKGQSKEYSLNATQKCVPRYDCLLCEWPVKIKIEPRPGSGI
ncbi:hypothetical protein RHVP.27 [Cricetid gammaherpesvirus 2]|uniref:Uncharacterized protein n=1 Tax=Cricetid gammaherpesvirus 2 TaxID=1605972 RepID=E9M5L0_9GAMA|nr:hypothetical protein RHVP.27 [Cricetid gammaherpesvirus 2]ADW24368.1 hypothetical protein RHVP.27 [Cricetid gammaherpesvirus 2]ADW24450.1 hypothetical protein RHVP-L.27 [Cricetid gammaherpesvirus 2]